MVWDYIVLNKGARNESKRSKTNHRFTNKNLKNAWPKLQLASVGMQNGREASEDSRQRVRGLLCLEG